MEKNYHIKVLVSTLLILGFSALLLKEDAVCPGKADVPSGTQEHTLLTKDGRVRCYGLYVPGSYKEGREIPLVIALHGASTKAERKIMLNSFASSASFIVLYPQGLMNPPGYVVKKRTWNGGACCGYAKDVGVDDVSFVMEMIENIERLYTIDVDRVYMLGFSNGGLLAYRLACTHPNTFAAIATMSSGPSEWHNCDILSPVSALRLMTDESTVAASLKESLVWNKCENSTERIDSVKGILEGKDIEGTLFRRICPSGAEEIQYHFGVGRHYWPPFDLYIKPVGAYQPKEVLQIVWDFFYEHPKVK
ncbi:hypothetical protein HYW58_02230 [Candidatus Kaiserbacteria bacterium]|nr:hypothetical protein [Candidatus Kaiserbacteria bacterium]